MRYEVTVYVARGQHDDEMLVFNCFDWTANTIGQLVLEMSDKGTLGPTHVLAAGDWHRMYARPLDSSMV
jgi:hypothetical protein